MVTLKPKESFKPSRIAIDNQEITDTKTIANEFNNYFATIGSRLAAQIPICETRTHKFYLDTPSSSSFFLLPVTNTEIIEIINNLNPNKSTGPFSIPVVLLKVLKNYISYPLEILFNCSFASGIVPNHFKVSKVIPVYKKGSPLVVTNYRPISLLSIFKSFCLRDRGRPGNEGRPISLKIGTQSGHVDLCNIPKFQVKRPFFSRALDISPSGVLRG